MTKVSDASRNRKVSLEVAYSESKTKCMRRVLFGGMCWFIFAIIIPDTLFALFDWGEPYLYRLLSSLSILIACGIIVYLMLEILSVTWVTLQVITGAVLLTFSEAYHVVSSGILESTLTTACSVRTGQPILMESVRSLGFVLVAGGFLYGIVELLQTRRALLSQQEQLQEQIAGCAQLEAENREYRLRMMIASRMSVLSSLSSSLGHEINNPLSVILGTCRRLENDFQVRNQPPDSLSGGLSLIRRNAERIERIVKSLYHLSRGERTETTQPVTLKAILSDSVELCEARFRDQGVTLDLSPVPEDIQINCRSTEISQVLLNLLNNALYAVKAVPEKWVRIKTVEKPGMIEIAIIDSGAGIPAEHHDKIFRSYFSTKSPGEGMGIGLSVSKGIIDAHGGSLYLDPDSLHTRFVICMPTAEPGEEGVSTESPR